MVLSGSRSVSVVLCCSHLGSQWFSQVLNVRVGSQCLSVVLVGSQCFSVLLVGSHRFSVFSYVLSCSRSLSVVFVGFR